MSFSIIHSWLHVYISFQKWSLTLEHLSLHLKPKGTCPFSTAASVTVHPKWQRRESHSFQAVQNPPASQSYHLLDEFNTEMFYSYTTLREKKCRGPRETWLSSCRCLRTLSAWKPCVCKHMVQGSEERLQRTVTAVWLAL